MEGTVKSFQAKKGFGFIRADKDYFFHREDFIGHWSDLEQDYQSKTEIKVSFEPTESKKGARARNVRRLDYPNQAV